MTARLAFPDADAATDVLTFAGRAGRLGPDAAVRLRAADGVLIMSTAVLAPRGLLDATPTVLAMRMVPVDPELVCDIAVTPAELSAAGDDPRAVVLPATGVTAMWAGVSPPRSGWSGDESISAAVLAARVQWGMAAVSDALPTGAGDDIVRAVRASVWGAPDDELAGLPRAVAFAAFALGFIVGDDDATVRRAPGWSRLTMARGHVLVRTAVTSGLTGVRQTGR